MPVDLTRYSAYWLDVSLSVKDRAGWRCEWRGLPHNAEGYRAPRPDGSPGDRHAKMDCRPENLAALRQRCRLNDDRFDNIRNIRQRRARRRREQIKKGQLEIGL